MKTFVLTEDQSMLRELAQSIAEAEIKPRSEHVDRACALPEEGMGILAEAGLLSCMLPEAAGGAGLDHWSQCCVIEEVAKQCASTAWAVAENAAVAECVCRHGSETRKSQVLPALAEGAFAAACAGEGLSWEKKGDGYVLNGRLRHVLLAQAARYLVVSAQAGGERLWFLLEQGQAGVKAEAQAELLGMKGCPAGTLALENCAVSGESLLAGDVEKTLDEARALGGAAIAAGISQGALAEAIPYANQRVQFGKPVSHFENNQQLLSDLLSKAEAARALVWSAAAVKDSGAPAETAAEMAKIFATDLAPYLTRKCVQVMGGYGYSREYPVERKMRDAKMIELLGGTAEELKARVAQTLVIQ